MKNCGSLPELDVDAIEEGLGAHICSFYNENQNIFKLQNIL